MLLKVRWKTIVTFGITADYKGDEYNNVSHCSGTFEFSSILQENIHSTILIICWKTKACFYWRGVKSMDTHHCLFQVERIHSLFQWSYIFKQHLLIDIFNNITSHHTWVNQMEARTFLFALNLSTLREGIFAGINFCKFFFGHFAEIAFRELGFTEDFAGINFRDLSLTKDFAGINFRKNDLFKDFTGP